jgi:catechol 2,3-dioxygenase-like lactoylglutathione lyase family enzyme
MSRRDDYPAGVPCFVDTLTADVPAAKSFYEGIFGWEFAGPGPMPGDTPGEYFVARVGGADVAGLGTLPAGTGTGTGTDTGTGAGAGTPPAWNTHVAVASADEAAAKATAPAARWWWSHSTRRPRAAWRSSATPQVEHCACGKPAIGMAQPASTNPPRGR